MAFFRLLCCMCLTLLLELHGVIDGWLTCGHLSVSRDETLFILR